MRPGLAAAEERVWLGTYLADLVNNQRVLVYTYTSLEGLVGQLENLLDDPPKKAVALTTQLMSRLGNSNTRSLPCHGLGSAGDELRALMKCQDVPALPPPFGSGAPQFAPHASNGGPGDPSCHSEPLRSR
jgi:hypothetical protein